MYKVIDDRGVTSMQAGRTWRKGQYISRGILPDHLLTDLLDEGIVAPVERGSLDALADKAMRDKLREIGLESVRDVAGVDPEKLRQIHGVGPVTAQRMVEKAQQEVARWDAA